MGKEEKREVEIRLNPEAKPIEFFFSPKMHFFIHRPSGWVVFVCLGEREVLARNFEAVVNSGTDGRTRTPIEESGAGGTQRTLSKRKGSSDMRSSIHPSSSSDTKLENANI